MVRCSDHLLDCDNEEPECTTDLDCIDNENG